MPTQTAIRARRCELLDQLSQSVDAAEWMWAYGFLPLEDIRPRNLDFQVGGEACWTTGIWHSLRSFGLPRPPPENSKISELVRAGEPFTRSIVQLVGRQVWDSRVNRRHVSRCRVDDIAYSIKPLRLLDGNILFSGVMLGRRVGKPDFADADLTQIHECLAESWIHTEGLERHRHFEKLRSLPRRLWIVYAGLIDELRPSEMRDAVSEFKRQESGSSRIRESGLKSSTINDYIKDVRRAVGVRRRKDL